MELDTIISFQRTKEKKKATETKIGNLSSIKTKLQIRSATNMAVLIISNLTYFLISFILFVIGIVKYTKNRGNGEAPGPFRWPIIGNLHLLRNYKIPYQGFSDLAKKYGDVYSLQMGSVPAVVVNGVDNVRQVLVQKGHQFDSRPNFNRYHQLFHGNKQNCEYCLLFFVQEFQLK